MIGSGPGGLAAALAAARVGVDVMLVERFGCLGGNITVVGVESIAWYRRAGTVDCEGIGIELECRARSMGATNPEPQSKSEAINADMFKYVADKLVEEAGVRPLLHAMAIDTIMEDGAVTGVIVHSKSGRGAILARRVVDASGDADLIHFAGAPDQKTPKEKMLPMTVMFSVAGVDRRRFLDYVEAEPHQLQGLGPRVGHPEGREGGRAVQPLPAEALRTGAPAGRHPAGAQDHRRHLEHHHRLGRGHLPQHDSPHRLRRDRRVGPDPGRD